MFDFLPQTKQTNTCEVAVGRAANNPKNKNTSASTMGGKCKVVQFHETKKTSSELAIGCVKKTTGTRNDTHHICHATKIPQLPRLLGTKASVTDDGAKMRARTPLEIQQSKQQFA